MNSTVETTVQRVRKRRAPANTYPALPLWPTLAPAIAVHLDMANRQAGLRLPIKLLRQVGMDPALGVDVDAFEKRLLVRGNVQGGRYRQDPRTKQVCLPAAGAPALKQGFAIVEGPDYLVLTTREDALKMAGTVPALERQPLARVEAGAADTYDDVLDPSTIDMLGWKDVSLGQCVARRVSRVASVSGHLWWLAGFKVGDPLRFIRYRDATVVEKGLPGTQHSTLAEQGGKGIPRHYFGISLFDTRAADRLRVIATEGRLIITDPDSEIGSICADSTYCPRQSRIPAPPLMALEPFTEQVKIRKSKRYSVRAGCINVFGTMWNAAGFAKGQAVRILPYADALVAVPSSESEMDFRLGSASLLKPYRKFKLAGTAALDGVTDVLVLSCEGCVVITRPGSNVAANAFWPEVPPAAPVKEKCSDAKAGRLDKPFPRSADTRLRPAEPAAAAYPLQPVIRVAPALEARTISVKDGRVTIRGAIWGTAGFRAQDPARLVHHSDALVIEACDMANMTFRVGSPSVSEPYRNLGLKGTALEGARKVRAEAQAGRLVLTAVRKRVRAVSVARNGMLELVPALDTPEQSPKK